MTQTQNHLPTCAQIADRIGTTERSVQRDLESAFSKLLKTRQLRRFRCLVELTYTAYALDALQREDTHV